MDRPIRCGDLAGQHGLVFTWTSVSSVQFPTPVQLAASDLCFVLALLPVDYHGRDSPPGFSEPDSSLCNFAHNQTDFPDWFEPQFEPAIRKATQVTFCFVV